MKPLKVAFKNAIYMQISPCVTNLYLTRHHWGGDNLKGPRSNNGQYDEMHFREICFEFNI